MRENIANKKAKSPIWALLFSIILPGAGQIYAGDKKKGIAFLAIHLLLVFSFVTSVLFFMPKCAVLLMVCSPVFQVINWIDAFRSASKYNASHAESVSKTSNSFIKNTAIALLLLGFQMGLASFTRVFIFPFRMPANSMSPTLRPGYRFYVNKWFYRTHEPLRGDVIAFHVPNSRMILLKRIIGVPGDTIKIENGYMYVNGEKLATRQISDTRVFLSRPDYEFGKEGEEYQVPENSYYVVGDNIEQSSDSRVFGYIPRVNIIGKAALIWWPLRYLGNIK